MPITITLASVLVVAGHAYAPPQTQPHQGIPERPLVDSLLVDLAHATTPAALPLARCTDPPPEVLRTCEALVAERRAELTGFRSDALHAEDLLERLVVEHPRSAAAWHGLGLGRLQLARDTAFTRGGALMPIGMAYADGAIAAFEEALRQDATFAAAADRLAMTQKVRSSRSETIERIGILRHVRGILSGPALLATANLEREVGNVDSAITLEQRALAGGVADSGLASLGLARDFYLAGRPTDGRTVLFRGAATPTAAAKDAYRNGFLSWVASPAELAAWDSLAPDQRPAWLATFWERRDIAEGRKSGARLAEHFQRLEYALKRYAITLPITGRQKLHTSTPGTEFQAEQDGEKLALRYGECFPELARVLGDARTVGQDTPFDYYRPVQDLVDDRGVVWIRHGAPSRTVQTSRGEAVEIWQYDRPGGVLELQFIGTDFQGSVGASTLVPTVLAMSPGIRNQVCSIDPTLCSVVTDRTAGLPATAIDQYKPRACGVMFRARDAGIARMLDAREAEVRSEGAHVSSGAILHARTVGREEIDVATTTDSYDRVFAKALHPLVDVYGLDGGAAGSPRAVIAFALPGDELGYAQARSAGDRVIYPVSIQVMAARISDATRTDTDTLRQFTSATPLAKGQFITGVTEVPLTPGHYSVSVVFTQADGHGAIGHLAEIAVPGRDPVLAVSDLVLGRENSGVHWNSGTTSVALNPLNAYPRGSNAEIYFQLSGLVAGTSYQMKYEVFRADDDPKQAPRLAVSSAQVVQQERLEVSRTLGLQQLDPGRYRVRLTVSGGGRDVSSVAWLTIVK